MDKVISVENIIICREAIKRLAELKINFDKEKLLEDIELCREIIRLGNWYNNEKMKIEKEG